MVVSWGSGLTLVAGEPVGVGHAEVDVACDQLRGGCRRVVVRCVFDCDYQVFTGWARRARADACRLSSWAALSWTGQSSSKIRNTSS